METSELRISGLVDDSELAEVRVIEEVFAIPKNCANCRVLTAKKAAEARGMVVRNNEYFPPNKEHEVIAELGDRATQATAGSCRFVRYEKDCWRRREEE